VYYLVSELLPAHLIQQFFTLNERDRQQITFFNVNSVTHQTEIYVL